MVLSLMKEFRGRCLFYHMRIYRGNITKETDNEPLAVPNMSNLTMSVRSRFLLFKSIWGGVIRLFDG